jgi:hypothetical protein
MYQMCPCLLQRDGARKRTLNVETFEEVGRLSLNRTREYNFMKTNGTGKVLNSDPEYKSYLDTVWKERPR